jgi:predicted  nucleic acid-binding Zn-ribbon protein
MKAARSGYSVEAALRERIDQLERDLHNATKENALLTEERDAALFRVDELEVKITDCQQLAKGEQSLLDSLTKAYAENDHLRHRLAIAHGEGDRQ